MKSGRVALCVAAAVVLVACEKKPASIQIAPPAVRMDQAGKSETLVATGLDAESNQVPLEAPTWASSDPKVATVDSAGNVKAVGSGTATITVTKGTVKGAATAKVEITSAIKTDPPAVTITKPDEKPKVVGTVVNEKGVTVLGRPMTFFVADKSIATVDAWGVVTGVKDGSTTLTVTSGTLASTIKVDVSGLSR